MKTRCDYCGDRLGRTRRRWLGYQFCKLACEAAWRMKQDKAVADFRRWLYGT
jgi:hypothetical protein